MKKSMKKARNIMEVPAVPLVVPVAPKIAPKLATKPVAGVQKKARPEVDISRRLLDQFGGN